MLSAFHWHDLIICSPLCLLIVNKRLKRRTLILYSPQVYVLSFLTTQRWENPLFCYNSVNWEMWLEAPSTFLSRRDLFSSHFSGWVPDRADESCHSEGSWQAGGMGQQKSHEAEQWEVTIPALGKNNPVKPPGKHPGRKAPGSPGEHQTDHAMCPCGKAPWSASGKVFTAAGGGWCFPSAEPWWDTPGEGPWRQLRAWRAGTAQPGDENDQGNLIHVYKYPLGCFSHRRLLSNLPGDRTKGKGTNWNTGNFI